MTASSFLRPPHRTWRGSCLVQPRPPARSRRIAAASLVAVAVAVAVVSVGPALSGGSPALAGQGSPTPPVQLPPAKASVVVDVGTGAVLEASNDRTPVAVASAIKIFTALVVHGRVKPADLVPISKRAASMPFLKLSAPAGQRWRADGLLHAMLVASANDAAVALAERAGGGTTAGYERLFRAEAHTLQLQDSPTLRDPAGLDDEFSVGGGNLISARDLAIVARAYLGQPDLAAISLLSEYRFPGGDGRQHRVVSHDRFLRTYPGAIGLKTGHTARSGYTLVAAARRSGHTLVAVVIQSANTVQEASDLLDAGFASVRRGGRAIGQLPGLGDRSARSDRPTQVASPSRSVRTTGDASRRLPAGASIGVPANSGWSLTGAVETAVLVLAAMACLVVLRRRQVVRRREAVRRRRLRERQSARA